MHTSEAVPMPTEKHVHGLARLELIHPRTGKVLKSAEGENFIGWAMLLHNRWRQRTEYNAGLSLANDGEPTYPWNQVVLLSSALAETAPDARANGVMRAWADKTSYAGADVYRGSMISADSTASRTQAIFTWEWPTHAGLGLINSVGVRATPTATAETWPIIVANSSSSVFAPGNSGGGSQYGVTYDPVDQTMWAASGTNLIKYAFDLTTGAPTTLFTGPTNAQMGLAGIAHGVACDTTTLYVANEATATIKAFTKPTGSGDVTESSITVSGLTTPRTLAYDGTYLWAFQESNRTFYRFNKTTGVIERSFSAPFTGSVFGMTWNTDRSCLMVSAVGPYIYCLDLNGTIVDRWSFNANQGTPTVEGGRGGIAYIGNMSLPQYPGAKECFLERFDANYSGALAGVRIGSPMALGSRSVLGAEVEKTNLTGMRLTYTFTFS